MLVYIGTHIAIPLGGWSAAWGAATSAEWLGLAAINRKHMRCGTVEKWSGFDRNRRGMCGFGGHGAMSSGRVATDALCVEMVAHWESVCIC